MDINICKKNYDDISLIYKFEYPYKSENKYESTRNIYEKFFAKLILSYNNYNFIDRIKSVKKEINNLSSKKNKEAKIYEESIQQFEQKVKATRAKISDDYLDIYFMMFKFDDNFIKYEDNKEAGEIFDKIMKSILNEGSKKCIQYEKKLIAFNDYLIDLKNKLNNIN